MLGGAASAAFAAAAGRIGKPAASGSCQWEALRRAETVETQAWW
jgi:hypothetical protein